jgi:hypothetical protein
MSLAQRFAQIFGAVYVLVGIVGFVPPLLIGPFDWGPFSGLLIGLFAVNWFHSVAHLAIGAVGLAVYRNPAAASTYALVLGAAYTLLFLLGLLGGPFGPLPYLLPLNGLDNVLHIVTALIAFGAYYASRQRPSPAR